MGKDEVCEVCGGTESKLVDGYYYCVECGTQDTNVRETLVELQMLDDGNFAFGRRTKFSVKRQEGVEMSLEWYKWHSYNFELAGLTQQLIELGAAPSLRMKVLWIWSRYIKMYQKKDEMSRFKALSQLESSSSSDSEGDKGEGAAEMAAQLVSVGKFGPRLDRLNRQVLVGILALALNHDRSLLQPSHVSRLVAWRLLPVNEALRFVPRDVRPRRALRKELRLITCGTLIVCVDLPQVMGRLSAMLDLGPPRVPDVEALLHTQLRELRLPRGLAPLVRALVRLLPVPWEQGTRLKQAPRHPDYETIVLAYVLVALKMCFGLDDEREVRLSDAVDRINRSERRPRAVERDPEPTSRLFSFREWAAHLRRRALLLSRRFGPLAWQRNMRTADEALVEHFDKFAAGAGDDRKKSKHLLSDRVTMDILGKIPRRRSAAAAGVRPLGELRRAAAAPAPAHALGRRLAPDELDEDFTRYDVGYAWGRGRGAPPLEGVAAAGKTYRRSVARHLRNAEADATIVYVKDCENKNWAKTKRPTAAHVVDDEFDPGRAPRGPEPEPEDERKLETFEEEAEGRSVFDDDLGDFKVKEEKVEAPEDLDVFIDETKDMNVFDDFGEESGSAGGGRTVFDSDEEGGPRYDPRTFDRAATIKRIMIAAYKKYIGVEAKFPIRFRTTPRPPNDKSVTKRLGRNDNRAEGRVGKRERLDGRAAIGDVVSAYQSSLARDAMHRVAEEVQRYVDAVGSRPDLDPPDPWDPGDPGRPDATDGDPDESRDVEVIENVDKIDDRSDDSLDEAAYDPVYRGDAKFDEKTHDASQLFLKLKDVPAAPAPAPAPGDDDDDSFLDDKQPDDDALREEKKRRCLEKMRMRIKWRRMKKNIDHLVEDPGSIPEFNYWFKHYEKCKTWKNKAVQVEIDESFPRSFRFVMRECAAALGAAPGALYRRLCDVERAMLSLLHRPAAAATRKPTNTETKTSTSSTNKAKHSNIRRKTTISNDTSDDASDWVASSDDASLPRDAEAEKEGVSGENIVPDDEPGPGPRRSGRIRERAVLDSFWR